MVNKKFNFSSKVDTIIQRRLAIQDFNNYHYLLSLLYIFILISAISVVFIYLYLIFCLLECFFLLVCLVSFMIYSNI